MKSEKLRVDCEYLGIEMRSIKGGGDQMICEQTHSCTCEGAPNYHCPNLDRLFVQRCSDCEHNRWPSGSCC